MKTHLTVSSSASLSFGPPDELFDHPAFVVINGLVVPQWDVHPDGTRFILTETRGSAAEASDSAGLGPQQRLQDVYLVVNWFTELKALMGDEGR